MVEVILNNGVCPPKWKDERSSAIVRNTPLQELLKITLSVANDKIPNVRLNVGRVLAAVIPFLTMKNVVYKVCIAAANEEKKGTGEQRDRDVLFFGSKCLAKVSQKLEGDSSHASASGEPSNRSIV
jgi:hypothetical protein